MSYSKILGLSFLVFVVGLALSPLFVSAQATTTGLLTVYVQVLNPNGANFAPSNFTAAVVGQSPSISNFPGSLQGTIVTLNPGVYSVTVADNSYGFVPSYSGGCNNTMLTGGSQLCVVTMTRYGSYYPQTYPSQYGGYSLPPLTCQPQIQTVYPGQQATFTAVGGVGGTYNWFTNGHTYANVGPSFSTVIEYPGTSAVTVTNASQTATCNVTLSSTGGYAYPNYPTGYQNYPTSGYNTYPTYSNTPYNTYPTYQNNAAYPVYTNTSSPTYTASYYPRLPNTGFEPSNGAGVAFAIVFLVGALAATHTYVRKAFAFALR